MKRTIINTSSVHFISPLEGFDFEEKFRLSFGVNNNFGLIVTKIARFYFDLFGNFVGNNSDEFLFFTFFRIFVHQLKDSSKFDI